MFKLLVTTTVLGTNTEGRNPVTVAVSTVVLEFADVASAENAATRICAADCPLGSTSEVCSHYTVVKLW